MIFYYLFSNFPFCQTQYLSFLLSSFLNVVFLPFPAATADDGVVLPLESLAKSFGYAGDNLTTVTVSHNGETYVKTLTYTGDKLTATSVWVKQ
jgi:hypothetical protein